jgi:hypothetical protein
MEVFCAATDCAQITTQSRPCAMYGPNTQTQVPTQHLCSTRPFLFWVRCHLSFCQRCTCNGIFCHQCLQVTFLTRDPPLTDPVKTAEVRPPFTPCGCRKASACIRAARACYVRALRACVGHVMYARAHPTEAQPQRRCAFRADDRTRVDRAFSWSNPSAQGAA